MTVYETITARANALAPELTALRRDLHKYAEPGWLEMRTTSIIAAKLTEMGYEVLLGEQVCKKDSRMGVPDREVLDEAYERACAQGGDPRFLPFTRDGMTGAIAILRCGEGPTVAMRFDIDALGVVESCEADHRPFAEGFASVNAGAMHACGHDGHACVGLGVAKILMDMKDQLHGTVKLIFQPAEEGVRGAKAIVDNGHLDGVDYLIGNHVSPKGTSNYDVATGAYGSLATGKYDVTFHGLAAHAGGSPEKGNNALLAAATALLNLQAIPRNSGGSTRINVGKLVGGSGRNVIADEAFMEVEVRGQNTELNTYMENYMHRILDAAAQMHGCTVEVKLMGAAPSLNSDDALTQQIADICTEKLGLAVVPGMKERSGGSEDFAYMMNRVQEQGGQAVFMRVRTQTAAGAHNRRYDFEESFIPKSIRIFCATVYDLMK